MSIGYTCFPLRPDLPPEGMDLKAMYEGRGADPSKMLRVLEKTAARAGLPFGTLKRTYNSRMAQELGKWAYTKDRGDAFHQAVYRAFFVDNVNIADFDVLMAIVRAVGLPCEEGAAVYHDRRFKDSVDKDWQRSAHMEIQVIPTYVANDRRLAGHQSLQALKGLLTTLLLP